VQDGRENFAERKEKGKKRGGSNFRFIREDATGVYEVGGEKIKLNRFHSERDW